MTSPSRQPQVSAHALLIDQLGRFLFIQKPTGAWALPSVTLRFDVPPFHQVMDLARRQLGIEVRERDLLLAHVSAHSNLLDRGGIGLVVSVGFWAGDPVPEPALRALPTQRWGSPGHPPSPLAAWERMVLPALMTISVYTEVGWTSPAAQTS